jgi:UDP-glucose 4-epimerase
VASKSRQAHPWPPLAFPSERAPMRALVTGGAGFVGSSLVDRLLAEGHSVDVIDDLSTGTMSNLHDARASGGALSFQRLDICSSEVIDVIVRRRPDVIFHLGNSATATSSIERPHDEATVTILGTLQLLEGAVAASVTKVVVALRAADFYGEFARRDARVTEEQRGALCSPLGASSRALLDYLALYKEREGLDFAALLIGEVYGPRERSGRIGAVATLVEQLRNGAAGTVPGDGRSSRDLVFVDDVVDALSRAATMGPSSVSNIGTGVATALQALRDLIASELGLALPAIHGEWPEGEVHACVLDISAAIASLGWAPWTELRDGIVSLLDQSGSDRGLDPRPGIS